MSEDRQLSFNFDTDSLTARRNASGRLSLSSKDIVGDQMAGLSNATALKICARVTGLSCNWLQEKHGHLKPGPRRMAMNNMIRGTIGRMNKEAPGSGDMYLIDVVKHYREAAK